MILHPLSDLDLSMLSLQGTQLYDPKAGGWRDLGMLDVMQVRINNLKCILKGI